MFYFLFLGFYQRYVCPNKCGSSYTRKDNLTRHMKTKCSVLKSYSCDICMKSYARSDALKYHLKMFHTRIFKSSTDNNLHVTL